LPSSGPERRAGALTLTVVYTVFTLLWVPRLSKASRDFDPTGNFFEEFSLVAAGAVLFAQLSPTGSYISRFESFSPASPALRNLLRIVHIVDMQAC